MFESLDIKMFMNLCKAWEMCKKVVQKDSMKLTFVPNHFKTQEMCERAAKRFSYTFLYISD